MSTPNPLIPQGTQLGQNARTRSFPVAIALIAALHVVGLGGLLFLGCSPNNKSGTEVAKDKDPVPPPVTSVSTPPPLPDGGAVANPGDVAPPVTANPTGSAPVTPPPVTAIPVQPPPVSPPPTGGQGDGWQPSGGTLSPGGAVGAGSGVGAGGGLTEYKVKKGDIGVSIAKAHGITVKALSDANPGVDWRRLKDGQTVQIPAAAAVAAGSGSAATSGGGGVGSASGGGIDSGGGRVHVVKKGETLISIGRQHGVSWRAIRSENTLRSDALREGQKLKIPAAAASGGGAARTGADGAGPVAVPAPATGGGVPR